MKICFIRNPYERLISGIRQRSAFLVNELKYLDVTKNTVSDFLQNLKKHNYIEAHFIPQTNNMNNFEFDQIISINQMDKLHKILKIEDFKKDGGHLTKYHDNDKINYYSLTIQDIYDKAYGTWSSNIYSWFTKDNIKLINELYENDFEWLSKNGFDYKIN